MKTVLEAKMATARVDQKWKSRVFLHIMLDLNLDHATPITSLLQTLPTKNTEEEKTVDGCSKQTFFHSEPKCIMSLLIDIYTLVRRGIGARKAKQNEPHDICPNKPKKEILKRKR